MRKIKRPKLGEYVLITRWRDRDPYDPWALGECSEIGEDGKGMFYKVHPYIKYFRNCFRITKKEGEEWLEFQKAFEI